MNIPINEWKKKQVLEWNTKKEILDYIFINIYCSICLPKKEIYWNSILFETVILKFVLIFI